MGYKQMDNNLTFTDLSLFNSMEHNRSIKRMEKINAIINWPRIERLLLSHYTVGKSSEGADAYPPLLLLKCFLIQQWFHIDSDPELETQINDRISFKKFLGLSFDQLSPDHSTFSRFRNRLSKKAMSEINHEVLMQFTAKGLTINEGIAIDARLVQSASHPLSTEKLEEAKAKSETPYGKVDKNGKALKFSRDLESNWVVKNNVAHFGLKEHASVDIKQGFVLSTEMTAASHNDSLYLPLCVAGSCHTKEPIKKVYADKGYFGKPNRDFLALNKIADGIMRKATTGTELTEYETERNKAISKVRYIVEQYFGLSHLYNKAYRARFPMLIKNALDALFRQMAFNLFRASRILKTA
jgi:IS5 family transposase